MKTILTGLFQLRKNALTIVFFIFLIIDATSQTVPRSPYLFGLSVGSQVSGNAHGIVYDANFGFYNGKNSISMGACIQKRSLKFCGANLTYMKLLTGKEDVSADETMRDNSKLQLFFYSRLQYLNDAMLSYNAIKREETLEKSYDEFPSIPVPTLSTIDLSVGAGLNVKIFKQLVWSNYIGISTFYHLNYKFGMYCDKAAPALVLGTTLKLNYFNR